MCYVSVVSFFSVLCCAGGFLLIGIISSNLHFTLFFVLYICIQLTQYITDLFN